MCESALSGFHCGSDNSYEVLWIRMNASSDEEVILVIWWMRSGMNEEKTGTKCWVHICFNRRSAKSEVSLQPGN
jgi:hypothetical protein